MGHKHSSDDILAGAVELAFADGLSRLSFGRVAKHLGINDRTVVYYFPTKSDLVTEVLNALAQRLLESLGAAFTTRATDHRDVVSVAWPILATPDVEPVFALFFEASGLATSGQEPFATVVSDIVSGWVDWTMTFIDGDDEHRRREAEAAVAIIDGLLLLRLLRGPDAADRAARALAIS